MKKLFYFFFVAMFLVACDPETTSGGDIQSVQISRQVLELTEGGQQRLTLEVTPKDATYKANWSSENELIATVTDKGVVTAVSVGETNINVAIEGTELKASCKVVVKSILEATIFDQMILNKLSDPYDFAYTKQSGVDTTIKVVRATFIIIPSTMYLDGEGYLVGEPGYCVDVETAFEVGIDPESGKITALYALADYQFADETAINDKGQLFPYAIKITDFNQKNYAEFFTQKILYYNKAIDEEPLEDNYPFYGTEWDSYMLKGLAIEQGIALLEAGSLTIADGNEAGLIQVRATEENELYPNYYNFDAVLFGTTEADVYGLALETKTDSVTGEIITDEEGNPAYYYMDKDGDEIFDMAPFVNYTFTYGKYEEPAGATEGVSVAERITAAKPVPAAPILKRAEVVKALNVPFLMKAKLR